MFVLVVGGGKVGYYLSKELIESGNESVRKLLVPRRHLQILVLVMDRRHEKALVRLAGDKSGAGVATLENRVACVEQQAAFHLLRPLAVTLVTVFGKDGANLPFKELQLRGSQLGGPRLGGRGPRMRRQQGQKQQRDQPGPEPGPGSGGGAHGIQAGQAIRRGCL